MVKFHFVGSTFALLMLSCLYSITAGNVLRGRKPFSNLTPAHLDEDSKYLKMSELKNRQCPVDYTPCPGRRLFNPTNSCFTRSVLIEIGNKICCAEGYTCCGDDTGVQTCAPPNTVCCGRMNHCLPGLFCNNGKWCCHPRWKTC